MPNMGSIIKNHNVSVRFRDTENVYVYVYVYVYEYALLICPTFRYSTLYERIEHYTARIDYNQDLYICFIPPSLGAMLEF